MELTSVCVGGGSDDVNLQTHTLLVFSYSRTFVFSYFRILYSRILVLSTLVFSYSRTPNLRNFYPS